MSTVFYKECHGCGKLVRFSSPEARYDWTQPCPFCGEMLVDTAFTTEVELSDPASVAAAGKEEEKHSYQIFSEYLLGDSAKEQRYFARIKEEQQKSEQKQGLSQKENAVAGKKHRIWWWIAAIFVVLGFVSMIREQGAETVLEGMFYWALAAGVAVVICCIKELFAAAPPRRRSGGSDRSKDDWVVRYTVYHELMKNDHCDCRHSSSHDCDCHHSSSHDCDHHH